MWWSYIMPESFRLFVASVGLPGRLIRRISKLNLKFFNSLTRFYSSFLFGYHQLPVNRVSKYFNFKRFWFVNALWRFCCTCFLLGIGFLQKRSSSRWTVISSKGVASGRVNVTHGLQCIKMNHSTPSARVPVLKQKQNITFLSYNPSQ